ncbi:hypothetical protein GCM10007063_05760 [Lentibacillus kapialis]|uniref:Uncharacterized protein n=1 Tax=Lentibacillus kapialis TaxID=340214 RepID=A0A917PND1_9BACI|nr:hypothetical protein [Lentibacillus kapialis]GGJ86087.1 hypothetical protein GCM10007063_05760 [Lentibacillus kapialis]
MTNRDQKINDLQEKVKKWHARYKNENMKTSRLLDKISQIEGNHDVVRQLEIQNTKLQAEVNSLKRQIRQNKRSV